MSGDGDLDSLASSSSVPSAALFSPRSSQPDDARGILDAVVSSAMNDTFSDAVDVENDDDDLGRVIYYSRPATVFAAVCAIIFTVVGIAGRTTIFPFTLRVKYPVAMQMSN